MYDKRYLVEFENRVKEQFISKKIKGPIHLSGGNEHELMLLFMSMVSKRDWVFSTHRNHYHWLLHVEKPVKLMRLIRRGDSMHTYDKDRRFFTSAIVGGGIPIAVGVAMSVKRNKEDRHVWCFVGDGATDSGRFYEAVRYGWNNKLPLTFVVEDNGLSCNTGKKERGVGGTDHVNRYHNVIKYNYDRTTEHTGAGVWVQF